MIIVFIIFKNYINLKKQWIKNDYYKLFNSFYYLEQKYASLGEFDVSSKEYKCNQEYVGKLYVWYPTEMENSSKRYPVIIVVNASNTSAINYKPFFVRLASWGFIVVGNDSRHTGNGFSTSKTLDYILSLNYENESVFYGKINEYEIGCIGYSQGGAGAINAVTAFKNSHRFKVLFTGSAAYSALSNNMGWGYDISKVKIPYFMTSGTGISDDTRVSNICKEFGGVAPLASLIDNYNKISSNVWKIRARVAGAEHQDIQIKTDGYMTAWMLCNLKYDQDARRIFFWRLCGII